MISAFGVEAILVGYPAAAEWIEAKKRWSYTVVEDVTHQASKPGNLALMFLSVSLALPASSDDESESLRS